MFLNSLKKIYTYLYLLFIFFLGIKCSSFKKKPTKQKNTNSHTLYSNNSFTEPDNVRQPEPLKIQQSRIDAALDDNGIPYQPLCEILQNLQQNGDKLPDKIAKTLVNERFNPKYDQYDKGWTVLIQAAELGDPEIIAFLLSYGADLEAKTGKRHLTALHVSALNGHEEATRLLLQHGPDITAQDNIGNIPLQRAIESGKVEVFDLILSCHAKTKNGLLGLNHKNNAGNTPLHMAAQAAQQRMVRMLLQHGADKELRNTDKERPYDLFKAFHDYHSKKLPPGFEGLA